MWPVSGGNNRVEWYLELWTLDERSLGVALHLFSEPISTWMFCAPSFAWHTPRFCHAQVSISKGHTSSRSPCTQVSTTGHATSPTAGRFAPHYCSHIFPLPHPSSAHSTALLALAPTYSPITLYLLSVAGMRPVMAMCPHLRNLPIPKSPPSFPPLPGHACPSTSCPIAPPQHGTNGSLAALPNPYRWSSSISLCRAVV
jgi:hypothetical protein